MPRGDGTGPMGKGPKTGQGLGGMGQGTGGRGLGGGKKAAGPSGECVCPKCGATVAHVVGQPCNQRSCPMCGTKMTRS